MTQLLPGQCLISLTVSYGINVIEVDVMGRYSLYLSGINLLCPIQVSVPYLPY